MNRSKATRRPVPRREEDNDPNPLRPWPKTYADAEKAAAAATDKQLRAELKILETTAEKPGEKWLRFGLSSQITEELARRRRKA